MECAAPTEHRVKIKENENWEKYLEFVRKIRLLWNMRVIVILIVIGALTTTHRDFEMG